MLIVSAKITAAPGKRNAFIKAAQPCIEATRREDGCFLYELYASTEHPDKVMFFERWASQEILDRHMATPHMAAFAKAQEEQGLKVGEMDLGIYVVDE